MRRWMPRVFAALGLLLLGVVPFVVGFLLVLVALGRL